MVYVIFAKNSLSCACGKAFLVSHSSRQSQWSGNCVDKHLKNMHTGGNCFSTGRHSMTRCGLFPLEVHCLAASTLTSSVTDRVPGYAASAQSALGVKHACSSVPKFHLWKYWMDFDEIWIWVAYPVSTITVQIMINQKELENVKYFKYLSSKIKNYARCRGEIKFRIAMAKAAFNKKKTLFTTKLYLNLRKKLAKCYISSTAFVRC
jgi:hypothetical protein